MCPAEPEREIRPAEAPADMATVRSLFLEYADWLQVDLCFQGFEAELAGLPGKYAPTAGGLWLALVDGAVAGIVGLRPLGDEGVSELKRLWIRPGYRGHGLGRRLVETAIGAARAAGYARICLDTLPVMAEAHALYESLGFQEIQAYYDNPEAGVRYLELELSRAAARSG